MGSGFRTFTAGEVLTASNVQNYLQDQVVMTFGGSAARSSAIGTANFEEGMVSYLTDTDKVEAYNGTNWVQVGSSNQGLTLINTTSFSAVASQSFNNVFSATYLNYFISLNYVTSAVANQTWRLRVSGTDASGAHYQSALVGINGAGTARNSSVDAGTSWVLNSGYSTAQKLQSNSINIFNPFATDWTTVNLMSVGVDSGNATFARTGGENHIQATSYDGFTIITDSGTMTGTVRIYGYNN